MYIALTPVFISSKRNSAVWYFLQTLEMDYRIYCSIVFLYLYLYAVNVLSGAGIQNILGADRQWLHVSLSPATTKPIHSHNSRLLSFRRKLLPSFTCSAMAMASALEMLLPSLARLPSSSFDAFAAASFVPTDSLFSSLAASPFLSDNVSDAAAPAGGGLGFATGGVDMFNLLEELVLVVLLRAETEDGAA